MILYKMYRNIFAKLQENINEFKYNFFFRKSLNAISSHKFDFSTDRINIKQGFN